LKPEDFVITRRRKKYKFAKFDELSNCFQADDLLAASPTGSRSGVSAGLSLGAADISGNSDGFASLALEIGAGTGLFSVELARRHPEKFFVAVDIKSDRLYTGAKLATELKLKNIAFVRSDIWRIDELFPEGSVSEIWVTFPDPYASENQTKLNKSDAKHRLTHPRFLEIYKQLLVRKGPTPAQLCFKTDNKPLFDWSKEQFEQSGWKIDEQTDDLHSSDLSDDYKIKTSYEERFTAEGLPIYCLSARISS
jgi:tRNA (guanine-N7-)-methyltransferase